MYIWPQLKTIKTKRAWRPASKDLPPAVTNTWVHTLQIQPPAQSWWQKIVNKKNESDVSFLSIASLPYHSQEILIDLINALTYLLTY